MKPTESWERYGWILKQYGNSFTIHWLGWWYIDMQRRMRRPWI